MVAEPLVDRFERGAIEPGTFDHASHIELVWSYLDRWPLLDVLKRISSQLSAFAASAGHAEKYHHTITWAFVFVVNDRRRRHEDFATFRAANADLFEDGRGVLLKYYRDETLASEAARTGFLFPDRVSVSR